MTDYIEQLIAASKVRDEVVDATARMVLEMMKVIEGKRVSVIQSPALPIDEITFVVHPSVMDRIRRYTKEESRDG